MEDGLEKWGAAGAKGAVTLLMTIYRQKTEDTDSLTYGAVNYWGVWHIQ